MSGYSSPYNNTGKVLIINTLPFVTSNQARLLVRFGIYHFYVAANSYNYINLDIDTIYVYCSNLDLLSEQKDRERHIARIDKALAHADDINCYGFYHNENYIKVDDFDVVMWAIDSDNGFSVTSVARSLPLYKKLYGFLDGVGQAQSSEYHNAHIRYCGLSLSQSKEARKALEK